MLTAEQLLNLMENRLRQEQRKAEQQIATKRQRAEQEQLRAEQAQQRSQQLAKVVSQILFKNKRSVSFVFS